MPHESTVAHEQRFVADSPMFSRSRQASVMDGKEVEPVATIGKAKVSYEIDKYKMQSNHR